MTKLQKPGRINCFDFITTNSIALIDLEKYARNLVLSGGIYKGDHDDKISYPDDGSNTCFQLEEDSFWFKHRNEVILHAVKNYANAAPIFDVGGGNGVVAAYLQKNGFETVLVEPREDGCFNAKSRNIAAIINSTFNSQHFLNESISNIGLFDVIEHIENQQSFLEELKKALVRNGILILTVPAYQLLWSEEDVDAGHYRRYSGKEIQQILETLDFKVIFRTCFFSFLILPVILFRTIPSWLGLYKTNLKQSQKQHHVSNFANFVLKTLTSLEITRISKGKRIKLGSSCLIIAQKQ